MESKNTGGKIRLMVFKTIVCRRKSPVLAAVSFVKYTWFQNLTFSHTPWEIASEEHACPQAEITLQATMLCDGARHFTVSRCDFKHTGAWCIDLR